jgi:predicted nucleotidyltransferase
VLATVLLSDEGVHIRRIADLAGLSYSAAQREVDRLEESGLLRSTRFQTSRLVRADERSVLLPDLRALLLKTYGPKTALVDLLRALHGVHQAFIFGSWAARYNGDWGAEFADVDVLLVGKPDRLSVEEFEAVAEDRLGRPVQATVVSPDEWRRPESAFVRTVQSRPLVEIELNGDA